MYRIQALILSIVLFFVGLIYGDKPIEIDYTVKIDGTEISAGDTFEWPEGEKSIRVYCSCENVGRPFEGATFYEPHISFYKYVNEKKVYLDFWSVSVDAVSQPTLIKKGETFDTSSYFEINPDNKPEPGAYTVEVSVYGCKQIFENALIIK
ncbi:MAG: hypothetical protein IJO73_01660 [Clostridia bacterium]|nr:hypothetical protein [Clostridia bacterium]